MSVCASLRVEGFTRVVRWGGWTSLALTLLSGFVHQDVHADPVKGVGFTVLEASTLGFVHTNTISPERYLTHQIPLNGSGVALGDVDGDGQCDVLFGGLAGGSRLYRNLGEWRFRDVTSASGLDVTGLDVSGVLLADLNGDGALDAVLNTIGQGTHVYLNDGKGGMRRHAVLNTGRAGMSLALADLDGDGDLDLYIANYRTQTLRDDPGARFSVRDEGGRPRVVQYNGRSTSEPDLVGRFHVTPSGVKENGEPDVLYLNDGAAGFTEVTWSGGVFLNEDGRPLTAPPYDWGLSVMARDMTGNGLPDIYVCNDFESPDRFWVNETRAGGPLRLRAISLRALRSTSAFSMGVDVADIDRDGVWDIFVLDMLSREHRERNLQVAGLPPSLFNLGVIEDRPQFSHNTLLRGRGDGTFSEIGRLAGVSASEWSWTPIFLDVDLDGFEDLLISNGHEMDMMDIDISNRADALKAERRLSVKEQLEMRRMFRRLDPPNVAFRNKGDWTFEDVSSSWGFDVRSVANGMALGDLDGDGDLDVVVNNLNTAPTIYRNDSSAPRLGVRLHGSGLNRYGIGAQIVVDGGPVRQQQEMVAGGRYLSSDDSVRTFAAGMGKELTVRVDWRSGLRTVLDRVEPGQVIEVREADARGVDPSDRADGPSRLAIGRAGDAADVWFTDESALLGHRHEENVFDDFARQPLLPRNRSMPGPGVTWADVNGDGWDDLLIGAGQGGSLAIFTNDRGRGFTRMNLPVLARPLGRDMTGILFYQGFLFSGSSHYEDGLDQGGALRLVDLSRGVAGDSLLGEAMSVGPLAMADVDADGALEFFVGGQARAGEYPKASNSLLVKTAGGRLSVSERWDDVGIVQGAAFGDLTGDGRPDLVMACEWGPIRVFHNREGKLVDVTQTLGLDGYRGWWQSVVLGDFDSDGRLDILAGNWGRNDFFAGATTKLPIRSRFGEMDGSGYFQVIDSYQTSEGREWPLRKLDSVMQAWPLIRERVADHGAYGSKDIKELYGDSLDKLPVLQMNWSVSTLFLNRGSHFEAHALPNEAQVSPVTSLVVADFDGDGALDAWLGQNVFAVHHETARQDAGVGVLLRGDGKGGFTTVPSHISGVAVYGEARGAAVTDFDQDGRPDFVVGQNGAETRLFRNKVGRPGVRIVLRGSVANPMAIGATYRWSKNGEGVGPVWNVSAGGGYLSVDGPHRVVSRPEGADSLDVRWPNGLQRKYEVPSEVREWTATQP